MVPRNPLNNLYANLYSTFSFGLVVLVHNSVWEWLAWIFAQKEDFQAPTGSNGQEVFEPWDLD